ncbi:MAG: methylmalonyl-CoA epimerase [Gemmatimonadota bacterium]
MTQIDHIGIATSDLEESVRRWSALLGTEPEGTENVPSEQVRVAFFGTSTGRIELLQATADDSPIARFIDRRGPGIHHVCVHVPDLELALARAESAGLRIISPRIRSGAGGHRVAFLDPKQNDGVLLELQGD